MIKQPVVNDLPVNILDNNELLSWIKKWDIYPFQFMEAYHAVKIKTIATIEEYLKEKGFIERN
jgi:hypothetical protein